ncbi:family 43 glycosylhydrolase [Altererythrobacter indicus]|uniref:Family 43 glycosylhydrolase n=1 Tax=Altericroceibacterium indicum TaxID=374177 RepID=A0A845ABV6_9SPHN|nr:glycoside hydrolase family 43 protein [Altericroceibacterium indicum]MXP26255.1 family 43 glycosylhydrolase [Altericroceibacterium indicum]
MKLFAMITAAGAALSLAAPLLAQPVAHIASVEYKGVEEPPAPEGFYRNPVLPGFQPDPSILRVGRDFYLTTSTFNYFPGIPIYHSTDLVNWRLIGHAIDRPEQFDFSNMRTTDAIYAPTISYYGGKFRILDTCVRCGGNFMLTADRPEGPWSDPIWLDFEGIDPSLFVDDKGRAWILNNGAPEGEPRYEGHRAIWIQQFDLGSNTLFGPRKVLVDGGVHPEDKPIWAEGPNVYKRGEWYYLMPAEGGTAEDHSQTVYRSRNPDGPYEAGPINPILTQRDLSPDRPHRVEATGHAGMVTLDDGTSWVTFLATRPFAGQSTLLGRETYLLPVEWKDGWPLILAPGKAVPEFVKKPKLPASPQANWSQWKDSFDQKELSPEWLRLRTYEGQPWFKLGQGLDLTASTATPGSVSGQPAFLGRRLRNHAADVTMTLGFKPEQNGDFAGLMAFMNENHFITIGVTGKGRQREVALRERRDANQPETGVTIATAPLTTSGDVELRMALDRGSADFLWRPVSGGKWKVLARNVDVEHMASVHAGLFTGLVVGPYAQASGSN